MFVSPSATSSTLAGQTPEQLRAELREESYILLRTEIIPCPHPNDHACFPTFEVSNLTDESMLTTCHHAEVKMRAKKDSDGNIVKPETTMQIMHHVNEVYILNDQGVRTSSSSE